MYGHSISVRTGQKERRTEETIIIWNVVLYKIIENTVDNWVGNEDVLDSFQYRKIF